MPGQVAGLEGRVAVITGGARGIGRACAETLGAGGVHVHLLDRDGDALGSAADELRADGIAVSADAVDVTDADAVRACVDAVAASHGSVDIVVNSAGVHGPSRPLWEIEPADWDLVLGVNLMGTVNVCRAAIPHMLDRWGRIVNIASIAGKDGNPNAAPYSASKAAVIGLTKSLGKELATRGVLVNAVAPAVVETDMVAGISEEHRQYMVARIPMGRIGTVDEVARLVAFLAGPDLSFSTGAVYDISGGRATY